MILEINLNQTKKCVVFKLHFNQPYEFILFNKDETKCRRLFTRPFLNHSFATPRSLFKALLACSLRSFAHFFALALALVSLSSALLFSCLAFSLFSSRASHFVSSRLETLHQKYYNQNFKVRNQKIMKRNSFQSYNH